MEYEPSLAGHTITSIERRVSVFGHLEIIVNGQVVFEGDATDHAVWEQAIGIEQRWQQLLDEQAKTTAR